MCRERSASLRELCRHALPLTVAVFAIASLPYAYGFLSAPADRVFTGLMFDVPDHAQYWSWVTASRHGLFISNTMTPEPNPAIFFNPMMWLLAQVQHALRLSFPMLFQAWRVLATALIVPAVLIFVRTFVPDPRRRWTAGVLAFAGSGLGWALVALKIATGSPDVRWPRTVFTVEPNTFWAVLSYPYLAIAQALILGIFTGVWIAYQYRVRWAYACVALCACALSASHAYDLITVYLVLGLFCALEWRRTRGVPFRLVAIVMLVGVSSAPIAVYYQQLTSHDPLWRSILAQYSNAGVWTPPLYQLPILMGVSLVLAALSFLTSGWTDQRRFLTVWAGASLCLIYLPVVYQIKLLTGWQFPLALLAADAWHDAAYPSVIHRLARPVSVAVLLALVGTTNAYLFAWRFLDLRRHSAPYYLHTDEMAALDWLSANAQGVDVVLAPEELGQFVPNYGGTRAYLAHWAMTNRYFERRDDVARFFDANTSEAWRADLLAREHVTLVLQGERPPQPRYEPPPADIEVLFRRPFATIYRVEVRP